LATRVEGTQYGSIGCVVGATYPEQLTKMRERMPNSWILIPGYGAQGGSAQDAKRALDSQGLGAVINSSRGIIFAYENSKYAGCRDWQHAVETATHDMIADFR
jgi:orotidine-5'-phosphate decarboxylase